MSTQTSANELSETVQKNARRDIAAWLATFVERHGGFVGSVHLAESASAGQIFLVAAYNLPARIQNAAAVVPIGKGVAGVAAERREPVVMVDLQTDTSGVARPLARASESKSSVTLPVSSPTDPETLLAVVGLGFEHSLEFTDDQIALFMQDAATIPVEPTANG
ncbi:GAF domain-containing protein [Streptomyces capitiformicae]|uniref:GAF domain-containing protein n=1 Tax=Streptomyces capitiformicae TaxID=2014920 RepID=A0A919DAG8_9ACTN|nr:GAF domain-containing protein [Streptomyces capitiformicae]GHE29177.1 hypothetical protein GCM10017771_44730 [Streptomyces capitiformicae]